jgi:hypothetical protein
MGADVTGLGEAVTGVKDILGMFFPDATEEMKAKMTQTLQLVQDQQQLQLAQTAANTAEANQPGMHFRDGAGWICVFGLGVTTLKPIIEWIAVVVGHPVVLPDVDTSVTSTMLMALLGLGGMHAAPGIIDAVKGND